MLNMPALKFIADPPNGSGATDSPTFCICVVDKLFGVWVGGGGGFVVGGRGGGT
jgi:hypothetical protein